MSVAAMSWASPVQPFFSYIGVSVGMPYQLFRTVCRVIRCSRSNSGFELWNEPVERTSEWTSRPSMSSAVGVPGQPVTSTYWKPW